MKNEDWIKILEGNSREDWEWYARWLQDENNDDLRAEAINFILENNLEPHYSLATRTYDWWSEEYIELSDQYKYSLLNLELLSILNNYTSICKSYWVGYKTLLDAKLALIEAWVCTKMDYVA